MKVCIVGDGLVSLSLAKAIINQGIKVDLILDKNSKKINKFRTIGISKHNIDFFNNNILDIKKNLWKINQIEIYSDNLKSEKLLDFKRKKDPLFSIIQNYKLYNILFKSLNKSMLFKRKINKSINFHENYNLVINCDPNNFITKKYFSNKFFKDYFSFAYTTIIEHKKITNNTAVQIFTKQGPLAFLPISNKKTSIVFSLRGEKKINLGDFIKTYNTKYSNIKINQVSHFKLSSMNLRNYHFKKILAFGELLHKLHPLAGQGFNMSIRDIKILLDLIKKKIELGIELDGSICKDFEKKVKHKNFVFSQSIDLIYELFNIESKTNNSLISKSAQFLGKKNYLNNFFSKYADIGIDI